jgi:hypothetical protein
VKPAETDLLCGVQPLRLERAGDLGRHGVCVTRQRWRNDGLRPGGMRTSGRARRPTAPSYRGRRKNAPGRLASAGPKSRRSFWGYGGSPSRTGADHKFLIVPQCTLSAGIGLCDICAKSEQLSAIPPVFTASPQLRRIAAINAVGSLAMTSRTGTARSTTNT